MDWDMGTDLALATCAEIERRIRESSMGPVVHDGVIYEDDKVLVHRLGGKVLIEGKPIKNPIMWGDK